MFLTDSRDREVTHFIVILKASVGVPEIRTIGNTRRWGHRRGDFFAGAQRPIVSIIFITSDVRPSRDGRRRCRAFFDERSVMILRLSAKARMGLDRSHGRQSKDKELTVHCVC